MALMTRGFLTTDEMGANRDPVNETFGYALKGVALKQGRENLEASKMANEAQRIKQDEEGRLRAEREAIGTAWMTPTQAMAEPAPQSPAPVAAPSYEPAVTEPVPAPAQIVPQNIPPQGQILTPQKIEQYAAQPSTQTAAPVQSVVQVPQMPMPQRYQSQTAPAQPMPAVPVQSAMPSAVQQEVPTTVAAQPVQPVQMPVASAPIEERQSFLRGTPEINGIKNPLADKTVSDRLNAIHQLYKDGKIRANTAVQYVDALVENQNKQIDRALDLQTKFDEIQTSDLSTTEKRLKVAAAVRDSEDNKYFEVYQAALTDKNAAKMVASLNGIPEADVENVDKLLLRAKRSPDYRAAQNAVLAQRKADLEARKVDATIARQEARDATDQARLAQGDRRLDIAEGRAAAADARAAAADARASRDDGSGSGSAPRPAGVVNEDGTISAVKVDKQGNRTLDPIVAKNLKESSARAEYSRHVKAQLDKLEKSGSLKAAPEGSVGAWVAKAQEKVGYSGDIRNARDRIEQFRNYALGVLNSPLMKGSPSNADAQRLLNMIGQENASLQVRTEAMNNLRSIIDENIRSNEENIAQYDGETRQKLKGIGVNTGAKAPSQPAKPNVSGWKVTVSGP